MLPREEEGKAERGVSLAVLPLLSYWMVSGFGSWIEINSIFPKISYSRYTAKIPPSKGFLLWTVQCSCCSESLFLWKDFIFLRKLRICWVWGCVRALTAPFCPSAWPASGTSSQNKEPRLVHSQQLHPLLPSRCCLFPCCSFSAFTVDDLLDL